MATDALEARQGVFRFEDGVERGWACNCFHGRLDGYEGPSQVLMCEDAPWWCPRKEAPLAWRKPPLCNTGVGFEEVDPEKPSGKTEV